MAGNDASAWGAELRPAHLDFSLGDAGADPDPRVGRRGIRKFAIIPTMKTNRYCAAALLLSMALSPSALRAGKFFVYVGAYTGEKSKGIYSFQFDSSSGAMTSAALAAEVVNPSFLTIHPNRKFLYAVSELGNDGRTNGAVTAFAVDAKTGALTHLNSVSSGGGGACHLVVDKTGKSLMVANYGSGSVAAFPLAADGRLGEAAVVMNHSGSSVDPRRQRGPHAHPAVLSAHNRFVFAPDLGLDQILCYPLAPSKAYLTPNHPPFPKDAPSPGARHLPFHPQCQFTYPAPQMGTPV